MKVCIAREQREMDETARDAKEKFEVRMSRCLMGENERLRLFTNTEQI